MLQGGGGDNSTKEINLILNDLILAEIFIPETEYNVEKY